MRLKKEHGDVVKLHILVVRRYALQSIIDWTICAFSQCVLQRVAVSKVVGKNLVSPKWSIPLLTISSMTVDIKKVPISISG